MVKENERLEDLEYKGLKIIQSKTGYCFTSDSVLLANLVKANKNQRIIDLGTGSGVIAILLAAKTDAKRVIGIEIQERLANMAKRSVEYNSMQEKVEIINKPMQNIAKEIGQDFDIVVSNPPYEKVQLKENPSEIDICKYEYKISLQEVVETANSLLKFGGKFYIINKAKRLADIIYFMKQKGIEPKKITMIQPKSKKDIDTIIVEGKKGGKPDLLLPKPFIIYRDDNSFTEEARRLYNK